MMRASGCVRRHIHAARAWMADTNRDEARCGAARVPPPDIAPDPIDTRRARLGKRARPDSFERDNDRILGQGTNWISGEIR